MLIKGQVVSLDFYISMVVLLLTISFLIFYFYYNSLQIAQIRKINDAKTLLETISNIFFDEGNPIYWDYQNVLRIGLANNNKINFTKLDILKNNISYSKFSSLFGTGIYYIILEIYDSNNNLIFKYPESLNFSGRIILKNQRYLLLNESFGKGIVYLIER